MFMWSHSQVPAEQLAHCRVPPPRATIQTSCMFRLPLRIESLLFQKFLTRKKWECKGTYQVFQIPSYYLCQFDFSKYIFLLKNPSLVKVCVVKKTGPQSPLRPCINNQAFKESPLWGIWRPRGAQLRISGYIISYLVRLPMEIQAFHSCHSDRTMFLWICVVIQYLFKLYYAVGNECDTG